MHQNEMVHLGKNSCVKMNLLLPKETHLSEFTIGVLNVVYMTYYAHNNRDECKLFRPG
uniref:Uncharacterized protein n=1 Tax=Rhizophora mucronata TaxID=61149 RepID=A0A2P2QZW6_RHIMU